MGGGHPSPPLPWPKALFVWVWAPANCSKTPSLQKGSDSIFTKGQNMPSPSSHQSAATCCRENDKEGAMALPIYTLLRVATPLLWRMFNCYPVFSVAQAGRQAMQEEKQRIPVLLAAPPNQPGVRSSVHKDTPPETSQQKKQASHATHEHATSVYEA